MLFTNGRVFTARSEDDFADAFRIENGRFSWVGKLPEMPEPMLGEQSVDLHGATVLPGLLDVHTHPAFMSELVDSVSCFPPAVTSIESLVAALRTHPARGEDGTWITGFGYDETGYPEARTPTRHDLDRVSDTQPVFVRRCDGHSAVCNTAALRLAGIGRESPDPPGAKFGRDAHGEPDGRLIEIAATDAVAAWIPPIGPPERIERIARLGAHFAERGIVGVGDLLATMIAEPLPAFRAARSRGWHPRTGLYVGWDQIKHDPPELTDDDRSGPVSIAGVKLFLDGAYSNRTAWTHDPYPGSCDHGMQTASLDDLRAAGEWARRNRVQVAVHAMGDRALDEAIGVYADQQPWMIEVPSVRLDHATLFSAERMTRLAEATMEFAVVSHTIFMFAEYAAYENNLSPGQFEVAYPIRSFFDRVPHTALASDCPATAWADADNVFVSIKAAVTRRSHTGADIGGHEAITVPQAVLLYTARAASCMRLDGLGRIEAGAEGSFVVLDRDVFGIAPDEIDQTRVQQTWVAGQRIFDRSEST